ARRAARHRPQPPALLRRALRGDPAEEVGRHECQRMQNVDRVANVEALSRPSRACDPRVGTDGAPVVVGGEHLDDVARDAWGWRDLRQQLATGAMEPQPAPGPPLDRIAFFVDGSMVPATQQGKVRQRRRASVRPVTDVMALAEGQSAARKAATAVTMVKGTAQRRWNRARPR